MNNVAAWVQNTSKALGQWNRRATTGAKNALIDIIDWVLEDVAFALMPIAIIMAIKYLSAGRFDFLYLSPEWSFPTIVLFGTAITRLIQLKAEIQRDLSNKLYSGTRLYVFFLVASAVVLALVILRQEGLTVNGGALWKSQILLLIISLIALYQAHKQRAWYARQERFPQNMPRSLFFDLLNVKLDRVQKDVRRIQESLRTPSVLPPWSAAEGRLASGDRTERVRLARHFRQVKKDFDDIEGPLARFVAGSASPKRQPLRTLKVAPEDDRGTPQRRRKD